MKFTQIAFEISNRCNYSKMHKECPASQFSTPKFLSIDFIVSVLWYLQTIEYGGEIYFNLYNEPLIDPRLARLMGFSRVIVPNAFIHIFTNGWNLNQEIADELYRFGNVRLTISAYTDAEYDRLKSINPYDNFFLLRRMELSPCVLPLYESEPNCTGPCLFPSIYPIINHRKELILCCRDYKGKHVLADLNKVAIKEAFNSDYRNRICEELSQGIRSLDLCKRCHFKGWGIV